MARVRHPNVVAIYGAQRIDDVTGLWMEFVEGRTLEGELARLRSVHRCMRSSSVCRQLCHALTAVHDAGLVHRDVKAFERASWPSQAVSCWATSARGESSTTSTGRARRWPVSTGRIWLRRFSRISQATPRSDLYSLGVLLFHLATGRYPVTWSVDSRDA